MAKEQWKLIAIDTDGNVFDEQAFDVEGEYNVQGLATKTAIKPVTISQVLVESPSGNRWPLDTGSGMLTLGPCGQITIAPGAMTLRYSDV